MSMLADEGNAGLCGAGCPCHWVRLQEGQEVQKFVIIMWLVYKLCLLRLRVLYLSGNSFFDHKALYLMHAPAALKFKTGSRRWRQRAPICEQGQALTWLEVGSRLQLHPPGRLLFQLSPMFLSRL